MLEEAYRPIKLQVNGEEVTMPIARAIFRALTVAAAKGEARAQAMFLKLVVATEDEAAAYAQMLQETREAAAQQPELPTRIVRYIVDPVTGTREML